MPTIQLQYPRITTGNLSDLRVSKDAGKVHVAWPPLGLSFVHPEDQVDDNGENPLLIPNGAITCTNSEFDIHEDSGIIFPHYAEFAVFDSMAAQDMARYASIRLGEVEATIGNPTPIMQYLFGYDVYGNGYMSGWDGISTIRLHGNIRDVLERKLLQALLAFGVEFHTVFVFAPLSESSYEYFGEEDEEEEDAPESRGDDKSAEEEPSTRGLGGGGAKNEQEVHAPEFCIADLDALRLFYSAVQAEDPAYSFLQYYRVIEYYSVLQHADELAEFRWDRTVSATEFVSKAMTLVSREDRKHICRLVARVASASVLRAALERKMIKSEDGGALGNALYDFRNSLVHAKYDLRAAMQIPTLFPKGSAIAQWRDIIQALARDAMRILGSPDR